MAVKALAHSEDNSATARLYRVAGTLLFPHCVAFAIAYICPPSVASRHETEFCVGLQNREPRAEMLATFFVW